MTRFSARLAVACAACLLTFGTMQMLVAVPSQSAFAALTTPVIA